LILTMTNDEGWSGERRRVDADFFIEYLGGELNDASYMVAGPPGLAEAATEELKKAGVDERLISTDSFSGY
jgi:NAD(P)H-flavin reductase